MYKKSNLFKTIFMATMAAMLVCRVAFAYGEPEVLNIDLKNSKYMQLDRKITRLAVGNPEIATVVQVPSSPNEFLIIAKGAGTTTLFVWTIPDVMYKEYVINVSPEDKGIAKLIQQAIGLPSVRVKVVDKRILLTGTVRNQYERNWAVQTARLYAGGGSDSSLSVGSGVEMSIKTQSAENKNNSAGDSVGGNKIQSAGEVIDLLHMLHPTQIRLEAQVIAIRPQDKENLGILYGNDAASNPGVFSVNEINSGLSFRHSTWTRGSLNLSLNALVTQEKAKILSRPSITTMSGEEAVIQVGGEIPYQTQSDNGRYYVEFKDYGIILQLKPIADAEDRITSTIHAEVSSMSGQTVEGQPVLNIRRADSVVTVRSGSTMVIGGLMDSSETKTVNKFPLLGDIPVLGEFFKYTSKSKDKQELIILVTPYIIDEDEVSQAQMSDSMQNFYKKGQEEKDNLNNVDLDNPFPTEKEAEESSPEDNFEEQEFDEPFKG